MDLRAILIFLVSMCFQIQWAHADQCLVTDTATAHTAKHLLESIPKILELCQPCHEEYAKEVDVNVQHVEILDWESGIPNINKVVQVSGHATDLAYRYVKVGANSWTNLAILLGCTPYECDPVTGECKASRLHGVSKNITEENGVYKPGPIENEVIQ